MNYWLHDTFLIYMLGVRKQS